MRLYRIVPPENAVRVIKQCKGESSAMKRTITSKAIYAHLEKSRRKGSAAIGRLWAVHGAQFGALAAVPSLAPRHEEARDG